jgi:hypothetical protein
LEKLNARKKLLGRLRRRLGGRNIIMDLQERGCEGVD